MKAFISGGVGLIAPVSVRRLLPRITARCATAANVEVLSSPCSFSASEEVRFVPAPTVTITVEEPAGDVELDRFPVEGPAAGLHVASVGVDDGAGSGLFLSSRRPAQNR
jgi:hypothetical protein